MSSLSAQRLLESKDLSAKAVWVRCCIAALKRWAAQILNLATLSITQQLHNCVTIEGCFVYAKKFSLLT